MINDMSLKMLHHIPRRTGEAASPEGGSGYVEIISWIIYLQISTCLLVILVNIILSRNFFGIMQSIEYSLNISHGYYYSFLCITLFIQGHFLIFFTGAM